MKRLFAGAALILLPFIFALSGDDQFRIPKSTFLAFMGLLYLSYELGRKIDIPLGLFSAWIAYRSFTSYTGFPWEDVVLFFGALSSAFWVVMPKDWQLKFGFQLFLVPATIMAVYGIAQHFGQDPFVEYYKWADTWRPSGWFGQSTLYGPYAVAGVLVALFLGYWPLALFLVVPVIMIDSSFTYLSLFGGIFVYLASKLTKWHLMILSLLSLSLLLPLSYFYSSKMEEALNDKGRFPLWRQTLQLANQHWVQGRGFGTFKEIYPVFQLPELRKANGINDEELSPKTREFIKVAERLKAESGVFYSAHNDFLQTYFETGIIGVFCMLLMALSFWRSARYCMWQPHYPLMVALVVAFCLNGLGSFPFRLVPQVTIPLWIYVIVTSRSAILKRA
jgi:O-antigen ligase